MCSCCKSVAPIFSRRGIDRIAEVAEAINVAAHRSLRDLESCGELGAAPETMSLQKRQQLQRSTCWIVPHFFSVPTIEDTMCPQCSLSSGQPVIPHTRSVINPKENP